jgi:hypothetical protein
MTNETLRQALACASRGWPVFPCMYGRKVPLTRHGFRDATTDERRITAWFGSRPDWNLAIATGAPGPDVLDVDQHGPAGNGYAAFATLRRAGLLDGAAAHVRTPSGGLHAYFRGSDQRNGHLPAHHLDFRSRGGYVLAPHPRSAASPTSSSAPRTPTALWTGPPSPHCWNPSGRPAGPSCTPTRAGT